MVHPDGESLEGLKRYTVKRLQGAEVRSRTELSQPSFEGALYGIPLPNLGSGISRIHVDATCLCLSISRCIDAASLPGSRGTLMAATESQSSAHPPGCLVHPFRDCPAVAGQATLCPQALGGRQAVAPFGSRMRGILRGSSQSLGCNISPF